MRWINRQRNILDFTISSLLRRKGKNFALFMIFTIIVFMLASVMFFTHSIRKEASLILKDAPEIIVQKMIAGRHDLISTETARKIATITGIESVVTRLWGYYYDLMSGANFTLIVSDAIEPGSITVGQGVIRTGFHEKGSVISFTAYDGTVMKIKISSIINPSSELVSSDLILISEKDFKRLFRMPDGYATDIAVKVKNPVEIVTIARKIKKLFPETRPIIKDEILRTYNAIFDWRSGVSLVLLMSAVLSFAIFSWDKTTGLSAEEKREIGILKAIGWDTSDVLTIKFLEGMAISLLSFMTGAVAAYYHVFFVSASLFKPVIKGWAVLYPDFRPVPFLDLYQLITLFFLTVVPYTIATIIPSWKAATMDPESVMRS